MNYESGENPFLRLSPNEIEFIQRKEREKWRIMRIQQVRHQSRNEAAKIREAIKAANEKQQEKLENILRKKWEDEQFVRREKLQSEYEIAVREYGQAHRNAKEQCHRDEARKLQKRHNRQVALERGRRALMVENQQKQEELKEKNLVQFRRGKIQTLEKDRSNKVAMMPTPPAIRLKRLPKPASPKKVRFHEAGTLITTSYIPTSVQIEREKEVEVNAKMSAEIQRRDERDMQIMQERKEEELEKKTFERGEEARKKAAARQVYNNVMEELDKADDRHQVSVYLKGDGNSQMSFVSDLCEGDAADHYNESRQIQMEKKAENILLKFHLKEREQLKYYNDGISCSKSTLESVIDEHQTEDVSNNNISEKHSGPQQFSDEQSGLDEHREDSIIDVDIADASQIATIDAMSKRPIFEESKISDIHLKKTVPADELPAMMDKFSRVNSNYERDAVTNSSNVTSSFEEISVRINIGDPMMSSPANVSNNDSTTTSEYIPLPQHLTRHFEENNKKLNYILNKIEASKRDSLTESFESVGVGTPSSYQSTEYYNFPPTLPMNNSLKEELKQKLENIKSNKCKVQEQIDELRKAPKFASESSEIPNTFRTLETPPKIYSEEIKTDGSGQRPISKRKKFELYKTILLQHYLKKLISAKPDDLTSSTIKDSGLDLSSPSMLTEAIGISIASKSNNIKSNPIFSTPVLSACSESKMTSIRTPDSLFSDIDTIPVKLTSSTPIYSSDIKTPEDLSCVDATKPCPRKFDKPPSRSLSSGHLAPKSTSSDSSSSSQSSSLQSDQISDSLDLKIHERMKKLSDVQHRLNENLQHQKYLRQRDSYVQSSQSIQEFMPQPEGKETTLDVSVPTSYQTPSREDSFGSTDVRGNSSFNLSNLRLKEILNNNNNILQNQRYILKSNEDSDKSSIVKNALNELSQTLPRLNLNKGNSHHHSNLSKISSMVPESVETVDGSSAEDSAKISSSSTPSMPDMDMVLKKFGLSWAETMNKRMDEAEERYTSNSSTN